MDDQKDEDFENEEMGFPPDPVDPFENVPMEFVDIMTEKIREEHLVIHKGLSIISDHFLAAQKHSINEVQYFGRVGGVLTKDLTSSIGVAFRGLNEALVENIVTREN